MVEFKRVRDARISKTVVEMNRVIIRLEKVGTQAIEITRYDDGVSNLSL